MSTSANSNTLIQQKFIERILKEEATSILEEQDRLLARRSVSESNIIKQKRSKPIVTSNNLEITHAKLQRFIDMKRIRGRKQKNLPIHNKIIYGHFNNIVRRLAFDLTEDVKRLIAQEHQIQL